MIRVILVRGEHFTHRPMMPHPLIKKLYIISIIIQGLLFYPNEKKNKAVTLTGISGVDQS